MTILNQFEVLGALEDSVELWDTVKRETLEAAKGCIWEHPVSQSDFTLVEMLDILEKSRSVRLAGNRDQYMTLSRKTRTLLKRDKERYVRSLADNVEGHLNANDFRPAYRTLKKLRSKSTSRVSAILTADSCLALYADGEMSLWADYFWAVVHGQPSKQTALNHWVTGGGCWSTH